MGESHNLAITSWRAEAGGEDRRELADRLTAPFESPARLVLLKALSAAANEITGGRLAAEARSRSPVVKPG